MKLMIIGSAHSVHIRKIAESLVESGHSVSIFSEESALTQSSPQEYPDQVSLYDKWPANKRVRKFKFLLTLNWYALRNNVDIVWFIYASSYGLLTKKVFTKAKKVVSVWGSDILINSYKKAYQSRISKSLNSADLVFSTSEFLRSHTRRLTHSKMILTPYGPNDSFFSKGGLIQEKDSDSAVNVAKSFDKIIVCTKWLKSVYGIDILLQAVALEPEFFRANNIGILICGEGQDSKEFKQIADSEDINDIVKFLGFQTEGQVVSLLSSADLAVFPSRSESFGVSLLECFSQQVPVICSSAGGFKELSQGGTHAHLVFSLDPQKYLDKIKQVFTQGHGIDLVRARAFAESYSWSKCMKHMESALMKISSSNEFVSDFSKTQHQVLDDVIFVHTEPRIIDENLTRAREIRISGFRKSFAKHFNTQEIFAGVLKRSEYEKMFESLLTISRPAFIYVEGSSSMFSAFSSRYGQLKSMLKQAKKEVTPIIYYLPDAHEYWDDYVLSTRSATKVHLARYRKKKLLRLLANYNTIIAYPSSDFKEALLQKLDKKTVQKLNSVKSLPLPPAASSFELESTENESEVIYIYAGGIGPFYKLQRLLIALNDMEASLSTQFYLRPRDVAALDAAYKNLLEISGIDIKNGSLPMSIDNALPVGILLLEPTEYISAAIPLKFYSYLERGWPIICYKNTAVANLVETNNLGWTVDANVDSIKASLDIKQHKAQYINIRKNIKDFLKNNRWENRVLELKEAVSDQ